ncbi:AarF/ABC1/UbiB kinase family protein [bacterium]|nr:AarF/ABC1/UbiB kinase family protein [bacterium]
MERPDRPKGIAVPSGRLPRLARFGGLAGRIAGDVLVQGARQFASGKRPRLADLILTPSNALTLTNQLAQLRGAAMKVGQLISMDAGEMLPPELVEIMARLRSDAHPMPPAQLKTVLTANWGADWLRRFQSFDVRPIAAASIGQVHRALTRDGRDLAIKVQYPGVRDSIDADVSNVATLIRMSGLVPKSLDLAPLLDEARRQLHEEADYLREGAHLHHFHALLGGAEEYLVPDLHPDLTTGSVLAMGFVDSVPIESLITAPQAERDRVIALLLRLMLRELFDFGLMQTDPNFANYRYERGSGRVVLLDFGATRPFAPAVAKAYRALLAAGLAGDAGAVEALALQLGFYPDTVAPKHRQAILAMIEMIFHPLRAPGVFDFGTTDLAIRLRDAGMQMNADRDFWHVPPVDMLFLQRKFGGMYLLASRLKARVEVATLLRAALAPAG